MIFSTKAASFLTCPYRTVYLPVLHGCFPLRCLSVLMIGNEQTMPSAVGILALFPQAAVAETPVLALHNPFGKMHYFLILPPQDTEFAR